MAVGAIVVANAMLLSLVERYREFGVLRAIGWSRRRLFALIFGEAAIIAFIGTCIGVGLAFVGVWVLKDLPDLAGILKPDTGEVRLGDVAVSSASDARRSALRRQRFGFVFQDGQLLPELPARENVALPLLLGGASRKAALTAADDWLERLGVAEAGSRRPGDMSGGQAQRVAVARAMVHAPAVLFADEPTGALDQATGHEVMQILTTTASMTGTTLVVVTHDTRVAQWCGRLVELRDALVHADRVLSDGVRP